MSVIAKMNIAGRRDFGDGTLVSLNCVYEGAAGGLNTSGNGWENRRFTTATPWGDGQLTTPHSEKFEHGKEFYLLFVGEGENYNPLPECALALNVRVQKYEQWPGTVSTEFVKDKSVDDPVTQTTSVNLRMAIDNPAASDQFVDGAKFLVYFYRADEVTLPQAAAGAE